MRSPGRLVSLAGGGGTAIRIACDKDGCSNLLDWRSPAIARSGGLELSGVSRCQRGPNPVWPFPHDRRCLVGSPGRRRRSRHGHRRHRGWWPGGMRSGVGAVPGDPKQEPDTSDEEEHPDQGAFRERVLPPLGLVCRIASVRMRLHTQTLERARSQRYEWRITAGLRRGSACSPADLQGSRLRVPSP